MFHETVLQALAAVAVALFFAATVWVGRKPDVKPPHGGERQGKVNIFVNRVYGLELQADITDRELIVILQAHDRGLVRGSKVAVLYEGERRYLDVEAIDRERTLPSVVFSGYTMPPPPPLAEAQAAELPKRPVWGVFFCSGRSGICQAPS